MAEYTEENIREADFVQRIADLNPNTAISFSGDTDAEENAVGRLLAERGYAVQMFGGQLYVAQTVEILNASSSRRPDV